MKPYSFYPTANTAFPPVNLFSLQAIQHFCYNIYKVICQHSDTSYKKQMQGPWHQPD